MKLLALLGILLYLTGCKSKGQETTVDTFPTEESPLTVTEVLSEAESYLGKEVIFKGLVNHVCSHSGKRCFVIDGKNSIRVEATENIGSFNKEISGNQILVKGVLREKQLDEKYIDDWECKTKDKLSSAENNVESCKAEMAEIQMMRDWMKEKNKNYYSVWYVDGTDYEMVRQ